MSAKVTVEGQVTLPKAVREAAGIRPGDRVVVRATSDGCVVVQRAGDECSSEAAVSALPEAEQDGERPSESKQLVVQQLQIASSVLNPFAAVVAAELEELGLSRKKIDEIMIRSAEKFGAIHQEPLPVVGPGGVGGTSSTYMPGWVTRAAGQAYDFLMPVVEKHGAPIVEKLAPVVADALTQAIMKIIKTDEEENVINSSKSRKKK